MSLPGYISDAAGYIQEQGVMPEIDAAVILGSGLGSFAEQISNPEAISYASIPHFPVTTVQGHAGELILGSIESKNIVAFAGRFHHYEGFSFEQTHIPVYIAKALNVKKLLISNAAGAVNRSFNIGDLVMIESVMRQNIAISARSHKKFRYNHDKTAGQAHRLLTTNGFNIKKGTYLYCKGPNYETKAEIRAFRKMGADMVGMSTAPELFEASRLKLKTVAISLVTNMAAGIEAGTLNHDEVKAAAEAKKEVFAEIIKLLVKKL